MSIVAYTGLPGGGKSYTVVAKVILPALRKGREVWTNVPLRLEEIEKEFPEARLNVFQNEELKPLIADGVPKGVVFVLDEVTRFWPSGMRAKDIPEVERNFFTEHRHQVDEDGNSMQIVLVTQDLAHIASFQRTLVEETFRAVKLSRLGIGSKYRLEMYSGAVIGSASPKHSLNNKVFGSYSPDVYRFYVSHTGSEAADGVGITENKVDTRNSIFRSWPVVGGLGGGVLLLVVSVYFVSEFFSVPDRPAPVGSSVPNAVGSPSSPIAKPGAKTGPVKPVQPVSVRSNVWRLMGFSGPRGSETAVLWNSSSRVSVRLALRQFCKRPVGMDYWICLHEGKEVTRWTGGAVDEPQGLGGVTAGISNVSNAIGSGN